MNIPYVIEQNNRGERAYDIYSRLLKDRILFLGSDLNSYTASLIVAQMLYLEADNPEADISFYINSMGGHIADGLAIYDTMQYIESSVQTICIGRAYNIAALLLASGQKGKRIALKKGFCLLKDENRYRRLFHHDCSALLHRVYSLDSLGFFSNKI